MLAPNAISIGRVKKSAAAVRTRDRETSIRNALARMRDASFSFFSPSRMPSSGAPPTPMREENAPIMVRMGPQTADTRERQITDRGNVADVHTVYNAVQNTHELCQHARKSNTGNQFSDRVGSEMVYSFHRKIPCRFFGWEQTAKKHARNKIRKTLFRTCRFWSVLIDQLTEKLFSKSGQIYFEIVRSLSVYGVVSGSLLCVQVDFDLAF